MHALQGRGLPPFIYKMPINSKILQIGKIEKKAKNRKFVRDKSLSDINVV